MGAIPRNYKINWLLLTTSISLSTLSLRRHLVPKTGYVWPEEGRGCSSCSRSVSWGPDRQIWQICVAVENNSTVSPCPKFTDCCSSSSDICSRPPRLRASLSEQDLLPLQSKPSGCKLWQLGHVSHSAHSGRDNIEPWGGSTRWAAMLLSWEADPPGSLLYNKTTYIPFNVQMWTYVPPCHRKESSCHPGIVHPWRSACTSLECAEDGVPWWYGTLLPTGEPHQNLLQGGNCSNTPSMSNGVTDEAPNGLPPRRTPIAQSCCISQIPAPIPEPEVMGNSKWAANGTV